MPGGVVIGVQGSNLSDLAIIVTLHDLHKRCRLADLEANGDAHLAIDSVCNLQRAPRLRHIDTNGLFAVHVLATGNQRVKMFNVEERRRGDLDRIDVWTDSHCLVRFVTPKGQLRIDGRPIKRGIDLIHALLPLFKLVRKNVGQCDGAGVGILRKGCRYGEASLAAAIKPYLTAELAA